MRITFQSRYTLCYVISPSMSNPAINEMKYYEVESKSKDNHSISLLLLDGFYQAFVCWKILTIFDNNGILHFYLWRPPFPLYMPLHASPMLPVPIFAKSSDFFSNFNFECFLWPNGWTNQNKNCTRAFVGLVAFILCQCHVIEATISVRKTTKCNYMYALLPHKYLYRSK